jgi:hypothetical protein
VTNGLLAESMAFTQGAVLAGTIRTRERRGGLIR